MKKILVIEDDQITQTIVKHCLEPEFDIISCTSIKEAKEWIDSDTRFIAFIIDRFLSDGDAISLCAHIRSNHFRDGTPMIFLSGAQTETDKLGAFYAGADDYITKPFSPLELKARVFARVKRFWDKFSIGPIQLDFVSHRAYIHYISGKMQELNLTRIEYSLLVLFARSPDKVFSREKILSNIWGNDTHVSDRVIDSHISHLRKKLAAYSSDILLESLRGEGYRMSITQGKTKLQAA